MFSKRFLTMLLLALTALTTVAPHSHHSVAAFADDAELAGRCDATERSAHHFDSAPEREREECVACMRHQQQTIGTAVHGAVIVASDETSHLPYAAKLRPRELRLASLRAPPAA